MVEDKRITALLASFFVALVVGLLAIPLPFSAGGILRHFLGITGSVLMALALVYTYRKRVQGKKGNKNPLRSHLYFGLVGPILVVLHSGASVGSLIGTILFLTMLLVVLTGIVGRYLFKKVNRSLKSQQQDLAMLKSALEKRAEAMGNGTYGICVYRFAGSVRENDSQSLAGEDDIEGTERRCEEVYAVAQSMADVEQNITAFGATKILFSRWIKGHIYLSIVLFAMLIVHVITSFYYGLRWL